MDHERWHKLHCRAKAAQRRIWDSGRLEPWDVMGRFWAWYDRQYGLEVQIGE